KKPSAKKATAKKATAKKATAKKATAKKATAKKAAPKSPLQSTNGRSASATGRKGKRPSKKARNTPSAVKKPKGQQRPRSPQPSDGTLTLGPTLESVLAELQQLGKPNTAKIYARHGVSEKSVGLAYADLKQLVKRLGTQHD